MWRGALVFAPAGALTFTFFINLCATIFQCGCQSLWGGAAEHCNIHIADSRHCPWCSYGSNGYLLALGLILAPQAMIAFWPSKWSWKRRGAMALAAFPAAGAVVAVAYGIVSGYWA